MKRYIFVITALLLPFFLSAQFDDIYFNPTNDKIEKYDYTNNYLYDNYDYYYTSRIRRFHTPIIGFDYFNPFYSNIWLYDPFYFNFIPTNRFFIGTNNFWFRNYYFNNWHYWDNRFYFDGFNSFWNNWYYGGFNPYFYPNNLWYRPVNVIVNKSIERNVHYGPRNYNKSYVEVKTPQNNTNNVRRSSTYVPSKTTTPSRSLSGEVKTQSRTRNESYYKANSNQNNQPRTITRPQTRTEYYSPNKQFSNPNIGVNPPQRTRSTRIPQS